MWREKPVANPRRKQLRGFTRSRARSAVGQPHCARRRRIKAFKQARSETRETGFSISNKCEKCAKPFSFALNGLMKRHKKHKSRNRQRRTAGGAAAEHAPR